ncbi:hypothetical protein B9Z55_009822 [Caenorhabditis nigoni]|uniref:Uncharacterized protein n=1 Tax=Caenorhabditis nigoni TaxID=1611254 RepID=A0A2G5UUK0_9PELO|nr:hypothetical protein B9Z55_009822 [Caenorhabditis nigoni]
MMSYLALAACIGIALTANVEHDVKSAVNEVTTTKDGDTYCPVPLVGTKCGTSSIFHYWKCCGELNKECCFNLQVSDVVQFFHFCVPSYYRIPILLNKVTIRSGNLADRPNADPVDPTKTWVWVVLALCGVIFIASFVISLVRCVCCRKIMLNLKVFGFCVIVVALGLVLAANNDGGAGGAYDAAAGGDYKNITSLKGEAICGGKSCGEGSFAHHYNCCGENDAECCFALQIWVYITLAVLVLIMIISTVIGIICCCCKK